ncbi:pentatricopeptide repeat-containing protein At3g16610-like [Aristolochia californica]|uniref:pentatricopeptide repeat-containing protein At3g16610-like n=1 Tax=Aristolochia californica TaxID=171875 RepID=UPI0035DD8C6D
MRGYFRNQQPELVLDLYQRMTGSSHCCPDNQTFNLVITACTHLSEYDFGSKVHSHARNAELEFDILVGTSLVSMYCKADDLETADYIFDGMPKRDAVSWNALICGHSRMGSLDKVIHLFRNMKCANGISPTEATFVGMVSVCGDLNSIYNGESVHAQVIKSAFAVDQFVANSLIEMYAKFGVLNSAVKLFEVMEVKDAISWSTMIGGFVQNGRPKDAVQLFNWMISDEQIEPTRAMLLNVVLACADLGDLQQGQDIEHKYIKSNNSGFKLDECLKTALVYMYTKCGCMGSSFKLLKSFSEEEKKVIAWNTMIKACVELGQADWALRAVTEMQLRGMDPDCVTFLTLIPLFASLSLLSEGMKIHACIVKKGFISVRQLLNSLIDMYAKCGHIEDCFKIFYEILDKDVVSWSSIIKSCSWTGDGAKAIAFFELMIEAGVKPNHVTFVSVLSACSHAGFVKKGRELYKSMLEDFGLNPRTEHICCMVDLFCRAGLLLEAQELIENQKMDVHSTIALWGALLSACRDKGESSIGEAAARQLLSSEPRNPANYLMLADVYNKAERREDADGVLKLIGEKELQRRPGCSWLLE